MTRLSSPARVLLLRETLLSIAIGIVISLVFYVGIFGLWPEAPLHGRHGLAIDGLPQTFMLGLMGALVPSLMLRAKLRANLPSFAGDRVWIVLARAVGFGALATVLIGGPSFLVLDAQSSPSVPFALALAAKLLLAVLVGGMVTPLSLFSMLRAVP
ncbi:hypothetical protein BH10PSE1_BH10PSE1_32530 [soil metagenome]